MLSGADPCSTLGGGGGGRGGYNSAFLPFFRDFEILGGILGFANFPSFNDFESLGVYSGFNENVLKQLKTRIRMHKINE